MSGERRKGGRYPDSRLKQARHLQLSDTLVSQWDQGTRCQNTQGLRAVTSGVYLCNGADLPTAPEQPVLTAKVASPICFPSFQLKLAFCLQIPPPLALLCQMHTSLIFSISMDPSQEHISVIFLILKKSDLEPSLLARWSSTPFPLFEAKLYTRLSNSPSCPLSTLTLG